MIADFRFEAPAFLFLLLLVPLLFLLQRGRERDGVRFPTFSWATGSSSSPFWNPDQLRWLRAAALLCLIVALARPQTGRTLSEIETKAVDITLVLDTSGSMRAMDFFIGKERVTRLEAVKSVVQDFIQKRPYDRIGMVVFGSEAFTQCPQTLDHGVLLSFLDQLEVGMAGDATAIGSAIGVGVKRLRNLPSKSRVMILLTDGSSNAGVLTPKQAADLAREHQIKIYTVGVGGTGKAPFLVEGFFGRQLVYQDVQMDASLLQQIAGATGGQYFQADDTESLAKIYSEIDAMEKSTVTTKQYLEYTDHFVAILWLGILLALAEVGLGASVWRTVP